jgi:hypothetical protein
VSEDRIQPEPREIWFLNRGLVVVRAKRPYVTWANNVDGSSVTLSLAEARGRPDAYLIPEFENPDESLEWLRENCSMIFDLELDAWHTDRAGWPADRSWKVFKAWFDFEMVEITWDLIDEPLSSDPDDV